MFARSYATQSRIQLLNIRKYMLKMYYLDDAKKGKSDADIYHRGQSFMMY
uniref:Uncharacterized protein n=1 Tax=Romanomermis culicivorax TaxID=13658 RepID=A0A915JBF1_ROMCU